MPLFRTLQLDLPNPLDTVISLKPGPSQVELQITGFLQFSEKPTVHIILGQQPLDVLKRHLINGSTLVLSKGHWAEGPLSFCRMSDHTNPPATFAAN